MKNINIGDWVRVNDPGLLMLEQFAPPELKGRNVARVYDIDGDDIHAVFPLGDDPIEVHSQASFYASHELVVTEKPDWYKHDDPVKE